MVTDMEMVTLTPHVLILLLPPLTLALRASSTTATARTTRPVNPPCLGAAVGPGLCEHKSFVDDGGDDRDVAIDCKARMGKVRQHSERSSGRIRRRGEELSLKRKGAGLLGDALVRAVATILGANLSVGATAQPALGLLVPGGPPVAAETLLVHWAPSPRSALGNGGCRAVSLLGVSAAYAIDEVAAGDIAKEESTSAPAAPARSDEEVLASMYSDDGAGLGSTPDLERKDLSARFNVLKKGEMVPRPEPRVAMPEANGYIEYARVRGALDDARPPDLSVKMEGGARRRAVNALPPKDLEVRLDRIVSIPIDTAGEATGGKATEPPATGPVAGTERGSRVEGSTDSGGLGTKVGRTGGESIDLETLAYIREYNARTAATARGTLDLGLARNPSYERTGRTRPTNAPHQTTVDDSQGPVTSGNPVRAATAAVGKAARDGASSARAALDRASMFSLGAGVGAVALLTQRRMEDRSSLGYPDSDSAEVVCPSPILSTGEGAVGDVVDSWAESPRSYLDSLSILSGTGDGLRPYRPSTPPFEFVTPKKREVFEGVRLARRSRDTTSVASSLGRSNLGTHSVESAVSNSSYLTSLSGDALLPFKTSMQRAEDVVGRASDRAYSGSASSAEAMSQVMPSPLDQENTGNYSSSYNNQGAVVTSGASYLESLSSGTSSMPTRGSDSAYLGSLSETPPPYQTSFQTEEATK